MSAASATAPLNESTVVRRIFDAFARKQGFALRDLFAPDAVWTVPGRRRDGRRLPRTRGRSSASSPGCRRRRAGRTRRGSSTCSRATTGRPPLYRASGERHGRRLDLDQVLLFRLEDGLVREVLALPSDPAAFEDFWAQ